MTDGKDYLILPEAKDYKKIGEGDKGLNTGGMGAVSPVPFVTSEFLSIIKSQVIEPTLEGLKKERITYRGFIFIGIMKVGEIPYVLEYNVRMGDPETQVVMSRIDGDFLMALVACAEGKLKDIKLGTKQQTAMTCICASGGYPESFDKGFEIKGLENIKDSIVFHAGTQLVDNKLVTSGGRVLAVTSLGNNIEECRKKTYDSIDKLCYDKIYFRKDIGLDLI